MKKITDIMHQYFENSSKSILKESCPIVAHVDTWQVFESPERLSRTFNFDCRERLKSFVGEILNFEDSLGHHGRMNIDHLSVQIDVYTLDLNRITNLDRDYAAAIDMINRDVMDFRFD